MLTGISWDKLPFPGTFQNGRRGKMSKIKKGNFPNSAHYYHRITMFISMYMFLRVPNSEIGFEQLTQQKRVKIQDDRHICPKFIICRVRIFLFY